jgi:hypothetical protein
MSNGNRRARGPGFAQGTATRFARGTSPDLGPRVRRRADSPPRPLRRPIRRARDWRRVHWIAGRVLFLGGVGAAVGLFAAAWLGDGARPAWLFELWWLTLAAAIWGAALCKTAPALPPRAQVRRR